MRAALNLTPFPQVDLSGPLGALQEAFQGFLDLKVVPPDLSGDVFGVPFWAITPVLLGILTLIAATSAIPWGVADRTEGRLIERRHTDAVTAMVLAGMLCSVVMAEFFMLTFPA